MKKHLIAITITGLLLQQPASAQEQAEPVDTQTFYSSLLGLVAGGLVAGPPGAVLGFTSGAVIGDLESQNQKLVASSQPTTESSESQSHQIQLIEKAESHQLQFLQQKQQEQDQLAALQQGFRFCMGFRTGSSLIEPKMAEQLDALAEMLKAFPQFHLLIEAGADQRGSESFNQNLSRERAEAVAQRLINAGLNKDRLSTRYQGESAAEYPVEDREGLAFDRMVQLTLVHGEAS